MRVESHPIITKFRNDNIRFKTCHAGRRSYKTEIGKRTLIVAAIQTPNESFFAGAPTRSQCKDILWNDLKELAPKIFLRGKPSETELTIWFKNGSEISLYGLDEPTRIEGKRRKGCLITETPHCKPQIIDNSIMPILRDTHGWAMFEGRPYGKNFYQELCERGKTDPEWKDYCWDSSDVMDPLEVAKDYALMDTRTYQQEYEGKFVSYEGRAYVYYDKDAHCFEQPFNPALPISVSCDFNITPCIWELGQDTEELTYEFDELVQKQTDIWKMCSGLKDKLTGKLGEKARSHKLIFYGDYTSSKSRDVSAIASSWQIIRDQFAGWNSEFKLRSNPRILDRVNAFNSRLRSADGKKHFGHSKSCIELMKDLERVDMEMLTSSKESAGERTHASDAVGYKITFLHPVKSREYTRFGNG